MGSEPNIRFIRIKAIYFLFIVLIIIVIVMISCWFIITPGRRSYCLERIECSTTYKEPMLGDFVRIPGGYFILPKDLKKTGYEIDSVYVNSFYMAVGKVSLDTYISILCSNEEDEPIRSFNNSINHLEQKQIGCFLSRVNQLSDYHYRIPNDVEWMYAYQYFETIKYSPSLQNEQIGNVDLILASLTQEPYEICSWENRKMKGDTVSYFALSEDLISSKGQYITKGDKALLYNRDVPAKSSGIRLVRF